MNKNNVKKVTIFAFSIFAILFVSIVYAQKPSFEIDNQSEPAVSNTIVNPDPQNQGNSVLISSKIEDVSGVSYARALIKNAGGVVMGTINLYDDGTNFDIIAGDEIFTNKFDIPLTLPIGNYKVFIITADVLGYVFNAEQANFNVIAAAASSDKAITVFDFNGLTPAVVGTVDEPAKTIALTVPFGTVVTALVPTITHDGASVAPLSGAAQDFTAPATYTVTASDTSTQNYIVTVTVAAASSDKAITVFDFNGLTPAVVGTVDEPAKTIALTVPFGTVVTALVPTITHDGASVAPLSGAAQDFTAPATYTVTASDTSTQNYIVTVTVAAGTMSVLVQSPLTGANYTEGDLVDFEGFVLGGTPDYTYEWSSDKDLVLSNERVFSSRDLSANTHTITLKVTDNNAVVAQDSVNITVQPAGTLSVMMMLEQTEFFQSFGYFIGGSATSGGTGVYSYQWNSNLAGNFSTDKLAIINFSAIPAWALGAHTITLTVTDGAGNTAQDTKIVNVVVQTILNVLPNNGDHFIDGQSVLFAVWREVGYNLVSAKWTSDIDGLIWNAPPFSFQKNDLSVGLHTITLELEDTMNIFLGTVTIRTFQIQIDPVPTVCNPDWHCTEWSFCVLGNRTRVCSDNNFCGDDTMKPAETEGCVASNVTVAFDWRNNAGNWMTPIRDQEGCGSCWAFATLGAVEAKYNIQNSDLTLNENLSEQDLVSCSYAGSCSGGDPNLAMHYLQTVGINNDICFPYQTADVACSGKCAGWQNNIWNIDGSSSGMSMPAQVMKDRIINDGPIVVAMNSDPVFNGWNAGTLGCVNDTSLNHAVVIVGYDDAGGYWIVRNSWGSDWNGDGYFEVLYGECGIESRMYYPGKVLDP